MTLVVDASATVAALVDSGEDGGWAQSTMEGEALAAPAHLPVEAANVLRRTTLAGELPEEVASLAYRDLLALPVDLIPFHPFAERIWELRQSVTAYDAWYVAVAEALDAPLLTLDEKLTLAPGPRCRFATP